MKKIKRRNGSRHAAHEPERCTSAMARESDVRAMRFVDECMRAVHALRNLIPLDDDIREPDLSVNALLCHLASASAMAASSIVILNGHGLWSGAVMLERLCFEHSIRARYAALHPDYAEWAVNIDFLRTDLRHNEDVMTNKDKRLLGDDLRRMERRYPHVSPQARRDAGKIPFHELRFADMMYEVIGDDDPEAYRVQSLLLHGHMYGAVIASQMDHIPANKALLKAASDLLHIGALMQPRVTEKHFINIDELRNRLERMYAERYAVADDEDENDVAEAVS